MSLDFSSLATAIGQLENSIAFAESDMAQSNDDLFEQLRNSVIQCFEFTYELSWKMLKRYLEEIRDRLIFLSSIFTESVFFAARHLFHSKKRRRPLPSEKQAEIVRRQVSVR